MMRPLTIFTACLWAGTVLGQSAVVNTRLYEWEAFSLDGEIQLDLTQYFQSYPDPGPVATFTINMPLLADPENPVQMFEIEDEELPVPLVVYKLKEGLNFPDSDFPENPYDPFGPDASDFEWGEFQVEFLLLPAEAPVTVANFITYTWEGAYEKTIIHRNESTGGYFQEASYSPGTPFPIIQGGGARLSEKTDKVLEWIPTRSPILFEETIPNTQGTLAMARTDQLNSATSQFFINLDDNSNNFTIPTAYAVFGTLVNPDEDLPVLAEFATTPVYDLSTGWSTGNPNIYPNWPFDRMPLYTPYWDDKDSYARITSVTIPEGDPAGITYSWAWTEVDYGDLEGEELEEAIAETEANRAVFNVGITGTALVVTRSNSGAASITVSGSDGAGNTANTEVTLIGYNPEALEVFPSSNIEQGGWIDNFWYDWMYAETFPYIVHLNHGHQYVAEVSANNTLYTYDFNLDSWTYTTSTLYPYMYSFRMGLWLYYLEETGNGFDLERWFYVYYAENPDWVTENNL